MKLTKDFYNQIETAELLSTGDVYIYSNYLSVLRKALGIPVKQQGRRILYPVDVVEKLLKFDGEYLKGLYNMYIRNNETENFPTWNEIVGSLEEVGSKESETKPISNELVSGSVAYEELFFEETSEIEKFSNGTITNRGLCYLFTVYGINDFYEIFTEFYKERYGEPAKDPEYEEDLYEFKKISEILEDVFDIKIFDENTLPNEAA